MTRASKHGRDFALTRGFMRPFPLRDTPDGSRDMRAAMIERIRSVLGLPGIRSDRFAESLPFSVNDTTVGSETELQAATAGPRDCVDLPLSIENSNYYRNIIKRAETGETSRRVVTDLEEFLDSNDEEVWENSWVRFPLNGLSAFARRVLDADMRADKSNPVSCTRSDAQRFFCARGDEECLRVPISYLIKLALADVIGVQAHLPDVIHNTGCRLMGHLLNDNTSPETFSFYVAPLRRDEGMGSAVAKEASKRFLLTQLLVMYANERFGLRASGQQAMIYSSPHPPIRQKKLNDCISDSFYRELFMSPCLSGWDDGLAKHSYMCLCHEVLSRSQINAVAKLREAGVLTTNLVVLPNLSNISLANNGTHVSLGSLKLTGALEDSFSGFTKVHEKFVGDLVIKIAEHFLPLFVGTYSGSPYRLDFSDFHPERVLGFLPHELDYTHLRMIWRRWKKKAKLKAFGHPVTPFGVRKLDDWISFLFRMKGDYVPDFRSIDYLVTLMSTDESPALNGELGNDDRLKKDLADLGVFDTRMSLYLLYRLRECAKYGFSGFEGRQYSLFSNLREDMAEAVEMQTLITVLAFKYALRGSVTHAHIPDDPSVESERRQIFFGSAIGLPTFYVRKDTRNYFLKHILSRTKLIRYSRRYPGYLRVYHRQFKLALIDLILEEARDLLEMLGLESTLERLKHRLENAKTCSAEGRLRQGILDDLGVRSPLEVDAATFNSASEKYYRTTLKRTYIAEALDFIREDLDRIGTSRSDADRTFLAKISPSGADFDAGRFLDAIREDTLNESVDADSLCTLINLVLLTIHWDAEKAETIIGKTRHHVYYSSPIRPAGDRPGAGREPVRGQDGRVALFHGSREPADTLSDTHQL